jgi:predicted O-linked N-acetylglucosamine transferase (SPINDLY family)
MAASHPDVTDAMAQAIRHHAESRLGEAEACYRRIIAINADHADAWNGLAVLAWQRGHLEQALRNASTAVQHEPKVWRYHQTRGLIASAMHLPSEAASAFERATALCPDSPEAWSGLAQALHDLQKLDDALAAYQRAQSLRPLSPGTANNFGVALSMAGRHEEAIVVLREALNRAGSPAPPGSSELWYNLGNALSARSASREAIAAFRESLKIEPGNVKALLNLGNVLRARRELNGAIQCYHDALALDPHNHDGCNNLGTALFAAGRPDEALEALQRAIALRPDSSAAHNNLGNVLKDTGRVDAAIAAYRRAMKLAPHDSQPHSNLLYTLYFHPDYDETAILCEARQWASVHAAPVTAPGAGAAPPAALRGRAGAKSRGKLHIGYVSPDFRDHCQSLFTMPLLSHHDHGEFKIHCYAHVPAPDATTRRLEGLADVWRRIQGSNDAAVEAMIRADDIDILVDLSMHMSNGRPLLFARKAAPVQVAWLAYPGTTGQAAIDFRLTDPWLDPAEFDERRYVERSIRLPSTFWCYDPGSGTPEVNELPALGAGCVTFGCLNNFCKVSDSSLRSWGRIMAAVPHSRLILLAAPGAHRSRVGEILSEFAIAANRIEFVPYQPRHAYLETYRRIDLCLDTLPYNGHTTSLDAYWMGVPVVTQVGRTVVGRAGWSQLNNLDLAQLATFDEASFVDKAVQMAGDLTVLAALRAGLRARLRASPLMDAAAFAAAIEAIYRRIGRLS